MKRKNFITFLVPALTSVLVFSCEQQDKKENLESINANSEPAKQPEEKKTDRSVLIGEWTRTDAPYQIKIAQPLDNGDMKAAYLNPKSINVASAMWFLADGVLKIYIELRDENYPGSNYKLTYVPEKDMLSGQYYQAVERITYDVGFLRAK